jgi:hypothetical protein
LLRAEPASGHGLRVYGFLPEAEIWVLANSAFPDPLCRNGFAPTLARGRILFGESRIDRLFKAVTPGNTFCSFRREAEGMSGKQERNALSQQQAGQCHCQEPG